MKATLLTAVLALLPCLPLLADTSQGETLERQMWENMKHRNYTAVESSIAEGFQSVHTDGARTRAQEIQLIKDLYLGSYKISDMVVTEGKDAFIVTYMISVSETIDDSRLSANATPRLSVWEKIDGKWQWIAHANLNPITPSKGTNKPSTESKK